jgi:hypothetical protein
VQSLHLGLGCLHYQDVRDILFDELLLIADLAFDATDFFLNVVAEIVHGEGRSPVSRAPSSLLVLVLLAGLLSPALLAALAGLLGLLTRIFLLAALLTTLTWILSLLVAAIVVAGLVLLTH